MLQWSFNITEKHQVFPDEMVRGIHATFLESFNLKEGWSEDGIRKRLSRSSIFGLLTDQENQIQGYAMYVIPDTPLNGLSFLWEDAIAIRKSEQGKGYSQSALSAVLSLMKDKRFGWLGGRTQNPIVIKRYARFGELLPFHVSYDSPEGRQVMTYMRKHIAEARDVKQLEPQNGVCRSVYYREGRLGDYMLDISGTEAYEEQLQKWGFNRDRGDAVLVVAKISSGVVERMLQR